MAKKAKPNFKGFGNKKSGPQKGVLDQIVSDIFKPASGHDSRKVHDTKGKNKHGRKNW